jgi:hypothetical protein
VGRIAGKKSSEERVLDRVRSLHLRTPVKCFDFRQRCYGTLIASIGPGPVLFRVETPAQMQRIWSDDLVVTNP